MSDVMDVEGIRALIFEAVSQRFGMLSGSFVTTESILRLWMDDSIHTREVATNELNK
jgi:hypothetical protein